MGPGSPVCFYVDEISPASLPSLFWGGIFSVEFMKDGGLSNIDLIGIPYSTGFAAEAGFHLWISLE